MQTRVGIARADLVGLAAWKSRGADRRAQSKTLIDLRIDPGLGTVPEPDARIQCRVEGLASDVGVETAAAGILLRHIQFDNFYD